MHRTPHWLAVVVLVLGTGLAAAWSTPATAAQSPGATWHLQNYSETSCFEPSDPTGLYGVYVRGRWSAPLHVGTSMLPSGGRYTTTQSPIPRGHSEGIYSLAWVNVEIPSNTPLGTYTAALWAWDGTTGQRVPITLSVESDCGY